jgi:UDP-N-acetylmuramate dehydrogenase
MAHAAMTALLHDCAEFVKANEPLATYTFLKLGGPAEALVQPRTVEELCGIVKRCCAHRLPLRVLGAGVNVLVQDEGVQGVVLRLNEPAFTQITVDARRVRAGCGAPLSALVSQVARHALAGLETLVGIPGTVGGALRQSGGDRSAEVGQSLRRLDVVDSAGQVQARERDDLAFSYRGSRLEDPVLLAAEFEFDSDVPDAIIKRMRKAWIQRKAVQPFSFQAACRMFQNPRGLSAAGLIAQAGLAGTKVGGAEVSERDANYLIAHPGATSRDVLRLIDLVRSRVLERFNAELELEITVW